LVSICYVGAQVACAAFFINCATENAGFDEEEGSCMLSYALIPFTVGRFIATGLLSIFESNFLLLVYAAWTVVCNTVVCSTHGHAGVSVLIVIFFFMAPMYRLVHKQSSDKAFARFVCPNKQSI